MGLSMTALGRPLRTLAYKRDWGPGQGSPKPSLWKKVRRHQTPTAWQQMGHTGRGRGGVCPAALASHPLLALPDVNHSPELCCPSDRGPRSEDHSGRQESWKQDSNLLVPPT